MGGTYDPLSVPDGFEARMLDLTVRDSIRQRDLPIRVYLPQTNDSTPVLLFSHGLGGSRDGSRYLGEHWSSRGYVVVCLQHPGSDTSVWKDVPPVRRMKAMQEAANGRNFLLRVRDVPVVLDQLERWNVEDGHALSGRMDLKAVGMSGHSFGAVTTQAVSGQTTRGGRSMFQDQRIAAALIMSPSSPRLGRPDEAFGQVSLPWMLMTGTRDTAPIGDTDMVSRLTVFPALPQGDKYELVLFDAEHSAFTDRALPGETTSRNPNHHRAILALGTAFWDAYLRQDPEAKAWLEGEGPRTILEVRDRWQKK